jgi:hypothetical protein
MKYRFGFLTATFTILAVAAVAVLLPIDGFAATPSLHAGAMALSQPFTDPGFGLVMAGAAFGTYDYWHPIRALHKHPAVAPTFVIAATSPDFPNGIMEVDATTGFCKLFAFENLRAQCANSADPSVKQVATTLKQFWSYDPAVDLESLTDEQKFNVVTNCAKATTLSSDTTFWPSPTMNTPDPSGKSRWIEGAQIPDAAALPTNVTLNDLPAIAQAILKRSALAL